MRTRRRRLPFRFIDLFAGIGGMRIGFEAAGGECVYTAEWNRFCVETYRANFNGHEVEPTDIRTVDPKDIPHHDVLVAGFPCQPFSLAGVSKKNALGMPHGFGCETQGTLFFDVARIIEHHRPDMFLLENVKHLLRHGKGETFRVIRRTLEEDLGYHVQWRVVDAKAWVPQHRERIFIAGYRWRPGFSFDTLRLPDAGRGPKLESVLHPEDGTEEAEPPYTKAPAGKITKKYILTKHLWNYLQDYKKKHEARGNGFGYGLFRPDEVARTMSARYYKDGAEILIDRGPRCRPRRLTPRECARIMGFDSGNGRRFEIPVSDAQAYRQFGNAVVPPVVTAIAKEMTQ